MSVAYPCKRCGATDADIGAGYCSACLFALDAPRPGELTQAEYERIFGMPWPEDTCPNCDGVGYIDDLCPGGPSGDALFPPEQAMCLVCSGTGIVA